MSTKLEEKAKEIFANDQKINKVFVTSDGYPFITENAAVLHKNTSGKKGLTVTPFTRSIVVEKKENTSKEIQLGRLNKTDLIAVAIKKGIHIDETATKKEIIKDIELIDSKKQENE